MSMSMDPVPGEREPTGHFLQLTLAGVELAIAATDRLLVRVLLVAGGGALGPVQLVQTKGGWHLVHVLPTVLPHHLTSIIVQFTIRTTGQFAETFCKSKLVQIFSIAKANLKIVLSVCPLVN